MKDGCLLRVRKRPVPVHVSALWRHQTTCQEALQLVFQADFVVRNRPAADLVQREPAAFLWQITEAASEMICPISEIPAE